MAREATRRNATAEAAANIAACDIPQSLDEITASETPNDESTLKKSIKKPRLSSSSISNVNNNLPSDSHESSDSSSSDEES